MTSSDESEGELEELEEKKKSLEIRMKLLDEKIKAKRNKKQAQISENHTTCSNENAQLSSFLPPKEDEETLSWITSFSEEMPYVDNNEDENLMSWRENERLLRKQKEKAEKQSRIDVKEVKYGAYKRTPSQCDIAGPMYEIKVSALLYVRAIRKKLKKFLLATSVEAAELYDDIRFAYETESGHKKQILVQLKHKDKRSISKTQLLAKKKSNHGFSLQGCYESFCSLQEKFDENRVLNSFSEFSEIDFVLCTNARAVCSDGVFTDTDLCTQDESILNMHGNIFSFTQNRELIEEFKKNLEITDDCKVDQFFNSFYIYSNQKCEQDLDEEIKKEIKLLYNISDYGAEKHFTKLMKNIQGWWRDRRFARMPLCRDIFCCKSGTEILHELNVEPSKLKFEDTVITKIDDVLSSGVNVINCITDIDNCEPSCDMLQQSFHKNQVKAITVGLEDIERCREDMLSVWPSEWCPFLAVYDHGMLVPPKSIENISALIKESLNNYTFAKLFLISKHGKFTEILFSGHSKFSFKEVNVTVEMNHLANECKTRVLNRVISFQGSDVTIKSVLGENCDHAIDAHLLSLLVFCDKKIQLGSMKNEKMNFYIDRVVSRNSFISKGIFLSDSKDIIAVSGITEDQFHAFISNVSTVFQSKNSASLQVMLPQINMMNWYSDGSLTDSTLVSSTFVISSLWKQINEISFDSTYNVQSQINRDSNRNVTSKRNNIHIIDSPEDFSKLCKGYKNKNVHWLNVQDGKLKWISSQGNLNTITNNLCQDKKSFPVNNVWDISDRIVILTGDSGMGKTSMLQKIALNSKIEQPETLIIQINLIECLTSIQNLDSKITKEKAREFLIQNGVIFGGMFQSSHLTFFKYIITKTNGAVLLVDGFDEVCFENENKVLNLIRTFFKLSMLKIWIASRCSMTSKLERIIGTLPFELQPLNAKEHEKLVNQLLIGSEQIRFYNSQIMPNYNDSQLLGNPLHCKMIAEMINNSIIIEGLGLTNRTGIDSLQFMEAVVKTKFKIYCEKYIHFTSENKQTKNLIEEKRKTFLKNHQWCALLEICSLPRNYKKEIIKQLDNFIKVVNDGAEKTGIISTFIGSTPHFEHKIYQEYFLALWLAEHCGSNNIEIARSILKHIIFDLQFSRVVLFFDQLMASTPKELILHAAIINCDWSTNIPEILTRKEVPEVYQKDIAGRTALHLALTQWSCNRNDLKIHLLTLNKQTAIIANLIHLGANLTLKDKILKWSPFRYSNIQTVPWNIVALMLRYGGIKGQDYQELVDRVKRNKRDALAGIADGISTGCESLLSFLLNNGVCVDDSINDKGDTALIIAASLGTSIYHLPSQDMHHKSILEYLHCKWHANPEKQNKNGDTPLHWACLKGHLQIVTYLTLKCKVSTETKNHTGYTPLLAAVRGGQLDIVRHLREIHKCSFQEKNIFGQSPIHIAAAYSKDNTSLIAYLVKKRGLDTEEYDCLGHLPVTAACSAGNINIVEFFVGRCGFSPTKELKNGLTLLHLVIIRMHPENVKKFIDNFKPCLNVPDRDGHTLFMWACILPQKEVCEYLMTKGANVKALSKYGNSALHIYIHQCPLVELTHVKWLVDTCEIDPNIENCDGLTALHLAIARSENPAVRDSIQSSVLGYLKKKIFVK